MNLPILTPDAGRADRVRARCHQQLARQRTRRERRAAVSLRVERTLMAGFAALYVAAVTANALSVFGLF